MQFLFLLLLLFHIWQWYVQQPYVHSTAAFEKNISLKGYRVSERVDLNKKKLTKK
jgi:hypothetical protein